jgi:ATP-dependent exoDNAse (exonuclease V) beta subunit
MPATIYKASAGSGKTYTLAQSWLTLALAQPTAYRHILSITFTRKATAEIKDRLLRFLFALAYSPDKQAALRAHLCAHVPCTDEALTQRARQLLSHLLQDYGRLSVHTIDGFFQRIIGAFVAELRLPRVHTLELDTERAARFMTDEVLRQLGHEPHLTHWVVQYAREQLAAGKAWQPDTQLQLLAAQLLSDKHLPFLLSLALSPQQLEALQDRCQQLLEAQHRALALLVQQANATLLAHDLHYDDFYKKYALNPLKALSKQLDNRQRLVFFEPNAHFVQALAGDKPWYAKTAPKTKALAIDTAMASGLHATLQALYTQGADPTSEARQLAITAWLVQQSLFRLGLYDYLKLSLDAYKAREGRVQLGEAGQLIARLHAQGQVPFLYEKLGERYTHLFLDEFQDTSTLQWQNLLPLLENALAGGGHALLVGDVKQSIYRFRGGNSTLLREQPALGSGLQQHHLPDHPHPTL